MHIQGLSMAKNPQFNFRVPQEVLDEFRAKVDDLRSRDVAIPEYGDAGQAALIMWARADPDTQMDWLARSRNYDIDAARLSGAGTAESAVAHTEAAAVAGSPKVKTGSRRKRKRA